MKKLMLLLLFPLFLVAKSGNAVIPHFLASDGSSPSDSSIYISNISSEDVHVKVFFYNEDATVITDDNKLREGDITGWPLAIPNYLEPTSGHSVEFTIGAGKMVTIAIRGAYKAGHGTLEWTQDSNRRKVLVAHGKVQRHSVDQGYSIQINAGQPF
jgi:hypothetical protein